ncbi:hypothetical protein [Streptomyces sp. V2I9]|uniref:hypothetical protein n=1 Tax=Streptomyces sp. V2I9 TaxID=3042304 RepID=UPI002786E921|nr:hypothetical protein [Streptomyces sp. V2I9]MDQ0983566.1 hypothetical protein [Streptomyces sp. V2I9]
MQTPALPDLAHTAAKPVHWLATAAAMAGVVALAGLLQPRTATATATASEQRTTTPHGAAAPAPDPAGVDFPLECGAAGTTVARHAPGDLDGDGRPETVAVVHCDAGSGTPPAGIYVLTRTDGAAPRVVATLVDPADRKTVKDFAVRGGAVSATLLGYSSLEVPRCCPDQEEQASWRWRGKAFVRSTGDLARSA